MSLDYFMSSSGTTVEQLRHLVFPKNRSIGILTIKDGRENYQLVGEAKGRVSVPVNSWIKLMVSREAACDLSPLTALCENSLQEVGLDSTPVTDEQLTNIRGLRRLLALGLSSTRIGNTGLAKLRILSDLKRLNLLGTPVDDLGIEKLTCLTS